MADRSRVVPPPVVGADALSDALAELRTLVYRLADEVASFRRRALAAEGRLREAEQQLSLLPTRAAAAGEQADGAPASDDGQLAGRVEVLEDRVRELETENAQLTRRLAEAAERTGRLLERTRFLRQQQEEGEGKR